MKAIVFDMDGVIFDTERLWKEATKVANRALNVNLSEKYRQTFCGMTDAQTRDKLKADHPEFDTEKYRDLMNRYVKEKIETEGVPLKNRDFPKIVAELKVHGFLIALATGSPKSRVETQFKFVNLNENLLFDAICTEDETTHGKPHPEIYLSACMKLNVSPNECYAIEDASNGIASAYAAGMHPIMVIDLIKPNKETKEKCEKVLRNLNQVKRYIIKQNS